jgi:hypothetical protein
MHRLSSCFVLGYHGCDRDVGERLLAGEAFQPSDNDYDWLGPGSASGRPTRAEVWNSPPKQCAAAVRVSASRSSSEQSSISDDRDLRASVDQGRVPRAASATGVGVRCTLICCRVPTDLYSDR